MSNKLNKVKSNIEEINQVKEYLFKECDTIVEIGSYFYDEYHGIGKILDLRFNDSKDTQTHNKVYITFEYLNEDKKKETQTFHDFFYYGRKTFIETEPEVFKKQVDQLIKSEVTIEELISLNDITKKSDSQELMVMNKDILKHKKEELIRKQNFIQSRVKSMMAIMERKRNELQYYKTEMEKQVKKLSKLILSIELYLGVKETLEQIQIGENADPNQPICLRQRLLYMDVEVGDPEDGGLDFQNIKDFDNWLLKENIYWKKKNYEVLVPEQKCIVVFRVRKDDKKYGTNNPFLEARMNIDNANTYILIRNGTNIYKIWSDLINITPQLFPGKVELQKLFDDISGESYYSKEDAENKIFTYKNHILLLQGLIERTPIFPDNNTLNLFKSEDLESGLIKFIYDNEPGTMLKSGIPSFWDWKKKINESIDEGSRVLIINNMIDFGYGKDRQEAIMDRLFKSKYQYGHNVPNITPSTGIYEVLKDDSAKKRSYYDKDESKYNPLYIKYNPTASNNSWYNKEYKNRLSFEIFTDDDFVLNYDAVKEKDLELLEYYVHSREGRESYLSLIPTLFDLIKTKKEELEQENEFIKLVLSQNKLSNTKSNLILVKETIEWWKLKNKWKRGIDKDDTKALRMISKKINKEINDI